MMDVIIVENNLMGGTEDGQEKFAREHGKDLASCVTNPTGGACQHGEAVNKALAVALGAGAAGGTVVALTPAAAATVEAGVSACVANPVLCANEVAIWFAEMGMGDALPAGLAVSATGKITAEQLTLLTEMKAAKEVEKQTGQKISTSTLENIVHGSGNKLDIRPLPDINGKDHLTAVKGDAKIPVDKIELYMRGKASGDLEALHKEYNSLKDMQIQSQKEFAKNPANAVRLKQVTDQMHNIERSRDMDRVLVNAGIHNTPENNSIIMDKLLDSGIALQLRIDKHLL